MTIPVLLYNRTERRSEKKVPSVVEFQSKSARCEEAREKLICRRKKREKDLSSVSQAKSVVSQDTLKKGKGAIIIAIPGRRYGMRESVCVCERERTRGKSKRSGEKSKLHRYIWTRADGECSPFMPVFLSLPIPLQRAGRLRFFSMVWVLCCPFCVWSFFRL
jgi:hypothetical protein